MGRTIDFPCGSGLSMLSGWALQVAPSNPEEGCGPQLSGRNARVLWEDPVRWNQAANLLK